MIKLSIAANAFNKKVDEIVKDFLPKQIIRFQKAIAFTLLRKIVFNTPVLTGRARGNWQVTINTPAVGQKGIRPGTQVVQDGQKTISPVKEYCVIFLTNNVPYILRLENGYSTKKAPQGMVAISLQEITGKLKFKK